MKAKTPIERAVDAAGSQAELARRLTHIMGRKIRQQHVWNWLFRDSELAAEYVIPVEKAINAVVTRHDLRPDIYPLESD